MSYLVPLALLAVAFVAALFGSYGDVLKTLIKYEPPSQDKLRLAVRASRYDHFGGLLMLSSGTATIVSAIIVLATR